MFYHALLHFQASFVALKQRVGEGQEDYVGVVMADDELGDVGVDGCGGGSRVVDVSRRGLGVSDELILYVGRGLGYRIP